LVSKGKFRLAVYSRCVIYVRNDSIAAGVETEKAMVDKRGEALEDSVDAVKREMSTVRKTRLIFIG
jgi:hypothetical protein